MAVTINDKFPRSQRISHDLSASIVDVEVSSETYSAGGISFDYEDYVIDVGIVIPVSVGGYVFEYDYDDKKIKVYYADYDATEDGELIEFSGSLTVTIPVLVIGTS